MEILNETTFKDDYEDFETEIGDAKQTDFYPQAKVKRWDNEVNFSIRLADDKSGTFTNENGKVKYVKDKLEAHFYSLEKGFEFEIILKEKPSSNVINFTLEHKGLDFFHQPTLTPQEVEDGCSRPAKVIGSYAVYHKTQKNNKYQTGKAFHIYRPFATDDSNASVWCDIQINTEEKTATITIPQGFLDNARYPVSIDPDFGYTSLGASTYGTYGTRSLMNVLNTYTPDGTETITSYTLGCHSGGSAGTFQIGSYYDADDDGWTTATLIGSTTKAINSSSAAFETTSAVSHSLSSANGHETALAMNTYSGNQITIAYDAATGGTSRDETNPLAATWTQDSTRDYRMSIYATYTTGGGATTITAVKLSGTFSTDLPTKVKISGSFVEKTAKVKVGGSF